MRSYFHCSTGRYARKASVISVLVGAVCAETALIAFVVMFFGVFATENGSPASFTEEMLIIAGIAVAAGLAVCFTAFRSADRKTVANSRYTYLDIQLKSAVISRYDKEFPVRGEKEVFRELYRIPFSDFVSAVPSRNGKKIVITGKIFRYGMQSDFLGYHIRKGDIEFDRWWLNSGGYETLDRLEFPAVFGSPERICAAFNAAKKRFDEIPPPPKHVFKEAAYIRKRPRPRAMPEDPDFSRRWR